MLLAFVLAALAEGELPALGGASSSATKAMPPLRNADYAGKLIGEPGGRILLRVSRQGGRRLVVFQARNIRRVCESGIQRATFRVGSRRLMPDRRFQALYFAEPELAFRVREFTLAKGRLLSGGRAQGLVFEMNEILDEPLGPANADECWSDGVVRWKAHRVSDRAGLDRDGRSPPRLKRPAARSASIEPGRYEGKVVQAPPGKGTIALKVNRRHHHTRIRVETEVRLECDGPDRIEKLGPFRIPVRADGRFDRTFFRQNRQSKHRHFTWVKGNLSAHGRAKGAFYHFDDPWDPKGTPNVVECGTPFRYDWTARRVR